VSKTTFVCNERRRQKGKGVGERVGRGKQITTFVKRNSSVLESE
jgi:hypothetical protein